MASRVCAYIITPAHIVDELHEVCKSRLKVHLCKCDKPQAHSNCAPLDILQISFSKELASASPRVRVTLRQPDRILEHLISLSLPIARRILRAVYRAVAFLVMMTLTRVFVSFTSTLSRSKALLSMISSTIGPPSSGHSTLGM